LVNKDHINTAMNYIIWHIYGIYYMVYIYAATRLIIDINVLHVTVRATVTRHNSAVSHQFLAPLDGAPAGPAAWAPEWTRQQRTRAAKRTTSRTKERTANQT